MVNFCDVKIPMFVACKDQIYSKPQPSSLFHTFKFKGNSVFHWKRRPRSCNKADTETSISADVELWKLPEGKHSNPAKPPPDVRTASEKQALRSRREGRGPGEGTCLRGDIKCKESRTVLPCREGDAARGDHSGCSWQPPMTRLPWLLTSLLLLLFRLLNIPCSTSKFLYMNCRLQKTRCCDDLDDTKNILLCP